MGILSIVLCAPIGIPAWIMGNTDMRKIREGTMDPEGESTTQAGRKGERMSQAEIPVGDLVPPSEDPAIPVALLLDDEPMSRSTRMWLVVTACILATVLGIACWINPVDAQGRPMTQGSHQQLGMPPCTLYKISGGWPCPGCGLTTSFSHFMHGNIWASLHANPLGTLMVTLCCMLVPWFLLSALLGRRLGIWDYSEWSCRLTVLMVVLLLVQWGVRLGWHGKPVPMADKPTAEEIHALQK
jgi:hypothetical protein